MEVSGQLHGPAPLLPGKKSSSTHRIGDLVGPRAGLDGVAKRGNRKPQPPAGNLNSGRPARSLVTILTGLPRL